MAGRYSRESLFEERDLLSPVRPPPRPRSESGYYERRDDRRAREVDRVDVRVRERSRERGHNLDRYFDDRQDNGGALVLRQREVETVDRDRRAPVRVIRQRSLSRSPSPQRDVERVVTRVVQRERARSPSPSLSPSPDRQRIRIVESHSRSRAPSPSPSPPPEQRPVIKGPVIEREVITHYTDVDHGVVYAGQPAPPPPPPEPVRRRERDLEVGVYTSRNGTEVDISEPKRRERRPSRPPPPKKASPGREVVVRTDRSRLEVAVDDGRQRSHSAAPARSRYAYSDIADDVSDEESEYITSRVDERSRVGEAYNGATRDWTIIDVPPGTERVRMDGAGGGAAEVTWKRYNGVRRTRFIPERDREDDKTTVSLRERDRDQGRDHSHSHDRINVQIIDDSRRRDREVDIDSDDRRLAVRAPADDGMWTEITKDLVNREAIERIGYQYTETEYFFYVLQYLHYDEVQELIRLTERIRRHRLKHQRHDSKYSRDEIDIDVRQRRRSRSRPRRAFQEEEREVIIDRQTRPRSMYR